MCSDLHFRVAGICMHLGCIIHPTPLSDEQTSPPGIISLAVCPVPVPSACSNTADRLHTFLDRRGRCFVWGAPDKYLVVLGPIPFIIHLHLKGQSFTVQFSKTQLPVNSAVIVSPQRDEETELKMLKISNFTIVCSVIVILTGVNSRILSLGVTNCSCQRDKVVSI